MAGGGPKGVPIIIRVPGCPMYTLLLQEKQIQPEHFSADLLKRIPYYGRGCAAGMGKHSSSGGYRV